MKHFTKCKKIAIYLFLFLTFLFKQSLGQKAISLDTLSLTVQQAEKRFLDSNFLLLAAHYNVDAQKALIQQAKLWDNPV